MSVEESPGGADGWAHTGRPSCRSFVRRSILRRPTVRASEYMKDFDIWQIHQTNKQKYFLDISRRVLDVFKNRAMTAQFIFIFEISYVIISVVIYSIWQISVFLFKKINNYFVDNPNVLIHDPLLIWKNFNVMKKLSFFGIPFVFNFRGSFQYGLRCQIRAWEVAILL